MPKDTTPRLRAAETNEERLAAVAMASRLITVATMALDDAQGMIDCGIGDLSQPYTSLAAARRALAVANARLDVIAKRIPRPAQAAKP